MNKRVMIVMNKTASMSKQSAFGDAVLALTGSVKFGALLIALLSSTAGGIAGWTAAKATRASNTDKENAQLSYGIGNLEASIEDNAQKLKASKLTYDLPQQTMRMM